MYKIEALDSIFYHCIKYIGYNYKHTYLAALLNMSKCLVVLDIIHLYKCLVVLDIIHLYRCMYNIYLTQKRVSSLLQISELKSIHLHC